VSQFSIFTKNNVKLSIDKWKTKVMWLFFVTLEKNYTGKRKQQNWLFSSEHYSLDISRERICNSGRSVSILVKWEVRRAFIFAMISTHAFSFGVWLITTSHSLASKLRILWISLAKRWWEETPSQIKFSAESLRNKSLFDIRCPNIVINHVVQP
jgi:hypothetical protein